MNRFIEITCMIAAAVLLTGCLNESIPPSAQMNTYNTELAPNAGYLGVAAVKASDEGQGQTAVESSLIWSQKYSETVEKLVVAEQNNRQLTDKNRLHEDQIVKLQQELKQCQKELGEANEMLLEMRGELDEWKTNVLGFREEMRRAQETQLIALRRVLKLLGAEVIDGSAALQSPAPEKKETAQ